MNRVRRASTVMTVLGALIVLALLLSMNTGHIRLSPLDVLTTLFGFGTERQSLILFELRMPRIVIALLVGAGLAVSGAILQSVSRNPLADPGLLGINAGAGLVVTLFVVTGVIGSGRSIYTMPFTALLGGFLTAALIYMLAYKRGEGLRPIRMVLMGVAVAAGISAAMIILTIRLDPQQFQFVQIWLAGSVHSSSWNYVKALLPWTIVLLPLAIYSARHLNVLQLSEHVTIGLGSPIERTRLSMIAIAVALAASSVAVSGGISFVGLLAPHITRRLVGPQHQYLIPASALVGSLLLVTADMIGRIVLQPSEVPVGLVVAMIGAPYFIYMLLRVR